MQSDLIKYLGIQFQSNLCWNLHIQHLKKKISHVLGFLYKFKYKFDVRTNLALYQSLIHSRLNYLPILYAYKETNKLKSLQRTQNKALKTVFNLPLMHPTISLYNDISPTILSVYGLYKMSLLLYVLKSINNIGHRTIFLREINPTSLQGTI